MSNATPNPYLQAALDAADAAAQVIRTAYAQPFDVRYKQDASPVTEVDENAEKAIKQVLQTRFPEHGFFGEEFGRENADADFLWLIDPIDGTKSFVRRYPVFSTQIALMHRGELIVGVSSAPCWYGTERLWAARGEGAWFARDDEAPRSLAVSAVDRLDRATLSTGNLKSLAQSPAWARFGELIPRLHRIRGYGDFLHYHWLADGKLDAVLESDLNILDIAALTVILREAGAVVSELDGGEVNLDTRNLLAAVPALHPVLLEALAYTSE